jgi:hypothetical protein
VAPFTTYRRAGRSVQSLSQEGNVAGHHPRRHVGHLWSGALCCVVPLQIEPASRNLMRHSALRVVRPWRANVVAQNRNRAKLCYECHQSANQSLPDHGPPELQPCPYISYIRWKTANCCVAPSEIPCRAPFTMYPSAGRPVQFPSAQDHETERRHRPCGGRLWSGTLYICTCGLLVALLFPQVPGRERPARGRACWDGRPGWQAPY